MTRTLHANFITAIQASPVRPVFLVKMETTGSTLYLATSSHDVSYGGQTYLGNGLIKSPIDGLDETTDTDAVGVKISFDAYDSALTALLLTSLNQSKKCYIYLAVEDSSYALINNPVLLFTGSFDTVEFTENNLESRAEVAYENELLLMKRENTFRYTKQSQELLFPGDLGFDYVAKLPDWSGFWGKAQRVKRVRRRKTGSSGTS